MNKIFVVSFIYLFFFFSIDNLFFDNKFYKIFIKKKHIFVLKNY